MPPRKDLTIEMGEMTVDKAKSILGWREPKKGEKGFRVRGPKGEWENVVLANNSTNRPFSLTLAQQYADQMLKGEWAGQWNSPSKTCNGETMVIDSKGHVVSCAHRLVGLILAEYERQRLIQADLREKIEEYGCKKPISIQAILVTGVDPQSADTNDLGKNRSLGDVLFRRHEFDEKGEDLPDTVRVKLSKELAVAVRLVWLRLQGGQVARGAKLYHPEAISFLESHPLLHDCVRHVYTEDGGAGKDGKKISDYLSLGYAAGLMYLAAFSKTDRGAVEEKKVSLEKKPSGEWAKAEKFWTLFAQDLHSEDNPVKGLHKLLEKNRTALEGKYSRDTLCTLVTRAWLAWTGEEKSWQTTRALGSNLTTKVGDKEMLNFERFGGLDLDLGVLIENGWISEESLIRKSAGDWKLKDTCWVDQPDIDPWYGEVRSFSEDGKHAGVWSEEDKAEYQCEIGWLVNDRPEREPEPTGDEE